MNHDPESLATALNASIEFPSDREPVYDRIIYRFEDSRLRYEMHIQPNTGAAFLAIDAEEPMQGCPMLEYTFRCTDILIGSSAYDVNGNEVAVRFYDGEISPNGQQLTLTWIPDGYWYIWADAFRDQDTSDGG